MRIKITVFGFIMSLVLIGSLELKAQSEFGLKVGPNFSSLNGDLNRKSSPRLAPMFGCFTNLPIAEKIYFQPEVMFSFQGANFTYRSTATSPFNGKTTANLVYLNFPFLMKAYLGEEFHLLLGPQLGFVLSSREKGTVLNRDFDRNINIKNKDLSLVFGAAVDVSPKVNIGARYNLGIVNLYREKSFTNSEKITLYNRVIQLHIGYTF